MLYSKLVRVSVDESYIQDQVNSFYLNGVASAERGGFGMDGLSEESALDMVDAEVNPGDPLVATRYVSPQAAQPFRYHRRHPSM